MLATQITTEARDIVVPVALVSATISAIVTAALVLTVIGLITAKKKSGGLCYAKTILLKPPTI